MLVDNSTQKKPFQDSKKKKTKKTLPHLHLMYHGSGTFA